jgi:WD40 repeat protein
MNHIFKIVILMAILLSSTISQAQGVTPSYIVQAARSAAEADIPDLGEILGWTHIIINNVTDTSLGCVLVTGIALPSPIDVYRLELTYGDLNYTVYVSSDATMVQLCDELFPGMKAGVVGANNTEPTGDTDGDGVLNSDDQCPTVAGVATATQPGCPAVTEDDRDGDGVLNSVDFCPDQAGATESDGCPLLTDTDGDGAPNVDDVCPSDAGVIRPDFAQGCPLDGSGVSPFTRAATDVCRIVGDGVSLFDNAANNATVIGSYNNSQAESSAGNVIGRTAETGWYQITGGWVTATSVSLTGSCYNIPIANATVGTTGCFLRSSGTFANVRNGPSTNDTQVLQIFPNASYAALGTDATTDWVFFNRGWVNRTVLELSGDCTNLPVLNPQFVGSGSVFFCPPDFNGYLQSRLVIGTANARITAGTTPNRLRAEPTVNSEQIGEIQPSRTLDAIIDGPACNEGYVWWQVNIDNTIGWTVESDINANAYYIEPIDGAGRPLDQAKQATPIPQAPPPSEELNPSTFQMITSANSLNVDTLTTLPTVSPYIVEWSPTQSVLATITVTGEIDFYSYPTFQNVDALYNLPDTLQPTAVAFSVDDKFLAIGNKDGRVYVVQLEDGGFIGGNYLPQAHTSPIRSLTWSHQGYRLASVSGFSETPIAGAEWTLKVWDMTAGTESAPNMFINYAFPYPLSDVAFNADDMWVAVTGESPADSQAALWIYNTNDTELYFSKGLVYMQGFSFVSDTPDPTIGDFVYGNGDTAYRVTVSTEDDRPIYSESGMLINEIDFRSQIITGAEILFAVTNATPGGFSGTETLTFVNALNTASPSAALTISTTDIAFSPDGRVIAVTDVVNSRLLILGVSDR